MVRHSSSLTIQETVILSGTFSHSTEYCTTSYILYSIMYHHEYAENTKKDSTHTVPVLFRTPALITTTTPTYLPRSPHVMPHLPHLPHLPYLPHSAAPLAMQSALARTISRYTASLHGSVLWPAIQPVVYNPHKPHQPHKRVWEGGRERERERERDTSASYPNIMTTITTTVMITVTIRYFSITNLTVAMPCQARLREIDWCSISLSSDQ